MDQLGAVAGKQYQGDGLSVIATPDGASLRCAFQRLEGQVTREGLWLSSTTDNHSGERFRVMAMEVGRVTPCAPSDEFGFDFIKPLTRSRDGGTTLSPSDGERDGVRGLPRSGLVTVTDNVARFIRPGLTEEYTVSVDGVRQDFIIEQRPEGDGELRVELDVTGARAEPLVNGARLVLDGSGRKLAYNRLRVTDATGRELPARMEVHDKSEIRNQKSEIRLAVLVDDAAAIYPVRIDPTFSDADWISLGGVRGVTGQVGYIFAMTSDTNGNLYVGGDFTVAGTLEANHIVKWDGNSWSALGSGLEKKVFSLAILGSDLIAAGEFILAGKNVAKWNGSTWSALGTNIGRTHCLTVNGNNLYAGGYYASSDTTNNYIAKWDGNTWSIFAVGLNNDVRSLAFSGTNLYVGGYFTQAGVLTVNRVAKWDGDAWSSLGAGVNNQVEAIAVSGTNLYAGGRFTAAGGIAATNIAKWNGYAWSSLGNGVYDAGVFSSSVSSLLIVGEQLFVGGLFTKAGGTTASCIAKWDGNSWTNFGSGMNYIVNAMTFVGADLYAGGGFGTADGKGAAGIARWNGNAWSSLGSGIDSRVYALAVMGTNLFAGGGFTTAGNTTVNFIAKWDGSEWSNLGSGMNSLVNALAVLGTNLYAGGHFTNAGGIQAGRIAKWNGNTWSSLGSGISSSTFGYVNTLAILGTNVIAAGRFSTAGGVAANNIAGWNGNSWFSLGSGTGGGDPSVYSLAVSGADLYVGGIFDIAGGLIASRIAKWNGSVWSTLGSGMNGVVNALVTSGTDVYAGGTFNAAGGTTANCVAKWNGSAWSTLGVGITNFGLVRALALAGTNLYVGGNFTTAGGTPAKNIARWNGSTWSALGSGIDGVGVYALTILATDLYAGGAFYYAGDKISPFAAKANISGLPFPGKFTNLVSSPVTGFTCTFLDASVGQPYRIQTSPSLAAGSWTDFTNFTYTVPVVITVPVAGNTNRFFRAITP